MMRLAASSLPTQVTTSRPARSALVVRASAEQQQSRRSVGLVAAVIGLASVASAQQALAKKLPFQEAMRSGSSTEASMSAFNMEGTKKRGLLPKKRAELMAQAKAKANEAVKAITK